MWHSHSGVTRCPALPWAAGTKPCRAAPTALPPPTCPHLLVAPIGAVAGGSSSSFQRQDGATLGEGAGAGARWGAQQGAHRLPGCGVVLEEGVGELDGDSLAVVWVLVLRDAEEHSGSIGSCRAGAGHSQLPRPSGTEAPQTPAQLQPWRCQAAESPWHGAWRSGTHPCPRSWSAAAPSAGQRPPRRQWHRQPPCPGPAHTGRRRPHAGCSPRASRGAAGTARGCQAAGEELPCPWRSLAQALPPALHHGITRLCQPGGRWQSAAL